MVLVGFFLHIKRKLTPDRAEAEVCPMPQNIANTQCHGFAVYQHVKIAAETVREGSQGV